MSLESPLIAVLDDELAIRKGLERLLRSAGMAVETFPSGADFLLSTENHQPDCLVLDLHMPEMTGFDVMEKIGKRFPVIILTGNDYEESRERSMDLGVRSYLRKPVDGEVLLDAIKLSLT